MVAADVGNPGSEMDKAAVFIDQGYFEKILSYFGHQKTETLPDGKARFSNYLDYAKFSDKLCALHSSERFRTFIYDALPYKHNPPNDYESSLFAQKQRFQAYLDTQNSFLTRYGTCMVIPNKGCYFSRKRGGQPCWHITQKGVDVRFTIDLVSLSADKRVGKAILITGDSDFIPAIKYAREQNMKIILYYLKHGGTFVHPGLRSVRDEEKVVTAGLFDGCLYPKSYPAPLF
ncbi:MAG: NYN domain-containing protein [Candidatus ainarchaeum sp.]|nr:NYN domain-containing protein [Candidatus ainarchaeum sp.]